MKTLTHHCLAACLLVCMGALPMGAAPAQTPPVPVAPKTDTAVVFENPFRPIDDRSVFSPATNRASPFIYTVESTSTVNPGGEKPLVGRRIGLGEMLAEFVKPTALMSLPESKEVFVNNRFYGVKDVMRIEVTKDAANYEYPVADLVVQQIGDDYVDLYFRQNQTANRITFRLSPEVVNEDPPNTIEGAQIRFLGLEEKVFRGAASAAVEAGSSFMHTPVARPKPKAPVRASTVPLSPKAPGPTPKASTPAPTTPETTKGK